jgi:ribosomal protein S12 methylthiotransferase accessory factor YcaO
VLQFIPRPWASLRTGLRSSEGQALTTGLGSAAGFHVGWTQAITERFEHRYVVNAIDASTGESFTVAGPDEYDALVELAQQVGIELED